ncbi:MAG: hypothetical protein MNPFHGCM_01880 [Gemmatimonadaceae bacterium]|nr:hypothetical protein [Gemmatimonadaceae bacterium]
MALEIEEKGEDENQPAAPPPPRRGPGHRGQDMRDTLAEMAAKAHEISLEAGSKMASAMKDVIGAAAGYSAFAIESARDLVQYMVRRGQMTQDEADKLIREAEAAHAKNPKTLIPKPEIKSDTRKVTVPPPAPTVALKPPTKPPAPAAKGPTAGKATVPAKATTSTKSSSPKAVTKPVPKKAASASKPAAKKAVPTPKPPPKKK